MHWPAKPRTTLSAFALEFVSDKIPASATDQIVLDWHLYRLAAWGIEATGLALPAGGFQA